MSLTQAAYWSSFRISSSAVIICLIVVLYLIMNKYCRQILNFINRHFSSETLVYIGAWAIVVLMPVLNGYLSVASRREVGIEWDMVLNTWMEMVPFIIIFIINAALLIPRLLFRQKNALYFTSVLLITGSIVLLSNQLPDFGNPPHDMPMRSRTEHMPPPDRRDINFSPSERPSDMPDFDNHDGNQLPPDMPDDMMRDNHPDMPLGFREMFHSPFVNKFLMALMTIFFNIAVALYFKSAHDKEAIKELKYNEMQTELEYLKYQINPHFFMNTLNNIHALVDIDTEKAKETIVELSKLMRYMLYEADKKLILLSKEVQFLRHYAQLMRIRYPEECVRIDLDMPTDTGTTMIPPLLFVSFVENAFKHGVSFRNESFVNVSLKIDEQNIVFNCSNSNCQHIEDQHHGIGLDNIKKRLELLYPGRYVLSIDEQPDRFNVLMVIPRIDNETDPDTKNI